MFSVKLRIFKSAILLAVAALLFLAAGAGALTSNLAAAPVSNNNVAVPGSAYGSAPGSVPVSNNNVAVPRSGSGVEAKTAANVSPEAGRGAVYSLKTVPNVHLKNKFNYVSNPDNIISPEDVATINEAAQQLQREYGIELAVVAIESIGDNDAREFATDLFKEWGIGQKGKDNGLLIQLITKPPQRSIVFETGYGLEGILPDAITYRLQQRYMISDFKKGDFSAGMSNGVLAVKQYLESSDLRRASMTGMSKGRDGSRASPFFLPFWVVLIPVLIMLFFLWRQYRPEICPKCKQRAFVRVDRKIINKATSTSEGLAMDVYRCRECGFTSEQECKLARIIQQSGSSGGFWGGGFGGGGFGGGFGGGSWGGGGSGGGGSISRF